MESFFHPSTITIIAHAVFVVAISVRVIMMRPATGVALAWLLLVAAFPFVGAGLYLLIGERRIGRQHAQRIAAMRSDFGKITDIAVRSGFTEIDWSQHTSDAQLMGRLGQRLRGAPTVHGSSFRLFSNTPEILKAIVDDVDAASVLMEFYIWNEWAADEVLEAAVRAAGRGVSCRLCSLAPL